jgi:hypothetical protein
VLLTKLDLVLAGDRTFHAGPEPIGGKPATLSGRGLHYTTHDNLYVDVWAWRATSGGPFGYMDDLKRRFETRQSRTWTRSGKTSRRTMSMQTIAEQLNCLMRLNR